MQLLLLLPEPDLEPEPLFLPEPALEPEPLFLPEPALEPEPLFLPEPALEPEPPLLPPMLPHCCPATLPQAEDEPFGSEPLHEDELPLLLEEPCDGLEEIGEQALLPTFDMLVMM